MTKDEAKWVAYKLYRQARDHFDRQQPKEKRILEYLLTIRDPTERRCVKCLTWVQVALQLQQRRDDCAASGLVVMRTQQNVVGINSLLCCLFVVAATSWTRQ